MEREAARRLSVRFQIDTSAAQAALAEMTRKLVRASEQLRPVLKALGEAQQRQEAAALKMGKGVVDAHRRAGLLPPER